MGEPKLFEGANGTDYRYDEFEVDDNKKRLFVNVGDMPGLWHGYKSDTGKGKDFVDLVANFHNISRGRAFNMLIKKYVSKLDPDKIFEHKIERKEKEKRELTSLPEPNWPLREDDEFSRPYISYLRGRGVTEEFISKCFYSTAKEHRKKRFNFAPYVIIPYYDKYGKAIYFTARTIYTKHEPRYYNDEGAGNYVYNIDHAEEDVVMVEGVFKAEKFKNCAIATGGKALTDEQIRLITARKFKRIIIMPDNEKYESKPDKADGSPAKAVKNARTLRGIGLNVCIFDWMSFSKKYKIRIKDIDDFHGIFRLGISDIEHYLFEDLFQAEMLYRLNEYLPR